jgi:hypothetical protein
MLYRSLNRGRAGVGADYAEEAACVLSLATLNRTLRNIFGPIFHSFWSQLLPSCFVSGKGDVRSDEGESDICVGESVG